MRVGSLKQLRETCLADAGGNQKIANTNIVKFFKEGIASKKLDPKSVSYKALFEGLVDLEDVDMNNAVQIAEAISASSFSSVTTVITNAIMIETYQVRANMALALVTQGEARLTDTEIVKGMTAIGGIRRRLENNAYQETDFEAKYVSIDKSDFGRIISLTMEDIFNDASGDIQNTANRIGEDAGIHMEQMIMETLEVLPRTSFGESTSHAFVYKGVAYTQAQFYAATHATILDFQVNCNIASGGITNTGLTNGYNNFGILTDERGKKIVAVPTRLVYNILNELTVANLLMTERLVGTNYWDVNQFGPRGRVMLNPLGSPFIASTSGLAYMGIPERSLLWLWVQKPQTIVAPANDQLAFERQIVWRARFNYYGGVGNRDYRWVTRITT